MQLETIVPNGIPKDISTLVNGKGILVWIHSPEKKLSSLQGLLSYGGVEIHSSNHDTVFFFQNNNSLSLTMLYRNIALKFDAIIHVVPAHLYVDSSHEKYVEYPKNIQFIEHEKNDIGVVLDGFIVVHSALVPTFSHQVGFTLEKEAVHSVWHKCIVNKNATVMPGYVWNVIIKSGIPITSERKSSLLWQSTLHSIEEFLRNKLIQVSKHNNSFLQIIFTSQEQMKNFIFDYQNFIKFHVQEIGEESFTATAVFMTLEKNIGMYAVDIDTHYNLSSSDILFNHFHTNVYDALVLGKDFVSVGSKEDDIFNSWVAIVEKQEVTPKEVQMLSPAIVNAGNKRCFYCGMKNHKTSECPTHIFPWDASLTEVWKTLGSYSFEKLIEISKNAETLFEKSRTAQENYELYSENTEQASFIKALFSITLTNQLRSIPSILSRKQQEYVMAKKSSKQEQQVQYFTKRLLSQEIHQVEYELYDLIKQHKDYRFYTFLGFINIEKGDYNKALHHWKEAERLSYTPKLVSWHLLLQGRAYEIMGQFNSALLMYKNAMNVFQNFKEARYRYIVTLIQMGRVDMAVKLLERHLQMDPEDFIKILLDPQAHQGYLEITRVLNRMLLEYTTRIEQIEREMEQNSKNIEIWMNYDAGIFRAVHENFLKIFEKRNTKDFLTYSIIVESYSGYQEKIQRGIQITTEYTMQRVERIFNKLYIIQEHLKSIPARSQFRDFTKQLEINLHTLEKVDKNSLEHADYFDFVIKKLDEIEGSLGEMEYSIYFMQVLRDATLFSVLFLRNFIFIEVIVALLIVIGIPSILYYASSLGLLLEGIPEFSIQLNLQKNTLIVATGIVLILVGSSTLLQFRKKKREIVRNFVKRGIV